MPGVDHRYQLGPDDCSQMRVPADGNGIIPVQEPAVSGYVPVLKHTGETLHSHEMRQIAGYDPATGTAMGQTMEATRQEQFRSNKSTSVRAAAQIMPALASHSPYVFECGGAAVFGQGAASQRLLRELRVQVKMAHAAANPDPDTNEPEHSEAACGAPSHPSAA